MDNNENAFSPVIETITKTINAYDKEGSILSIGRIDCFDKLIEAKHHEITIVDNNDNSDLKSLQNDIDVIDADLSADVSSKLNGKEFKFVLIADKLVSLNKEDKILLIRSLIENNMVIGGILFIGGCIVKTNEEKETFKDNAFYSNIIVYEDLKESFPRMVFQKVSEHEGILALAKGKRDVKKDEDSEVVAKKIEKASEHTPGYWYQLAEEEIAEQKNKEETQSSYREPDREIVQSWVRMKDVPGETMLELGNNFMAAIRPYEQEALKNWSRYSTQLQNLYRGTFNGNDIIEFRATAVTNYFKASNPTLTKDGDYAEWLARLYAAVFLRRRFPMDKIGFNLFGLYYGIIADLKVIFMTIGENYNDLDTLIYEVDNLKGSRLAEILLTGFNRSKR